jgi:prephenate dehydrogenase
VFAERVAVVGTGLIGGSVAMGLRSAAPNLRVTGFDHDDAALKEATRRGALTDAATSPAHAVEGADVVVVAVPVDRVGESCRELLPGLGDDAVVTDVGSAKSRVVEEAQAVMGGRFVGGHPMAGSERHGMSAADPRLFDGAWWILTPTSQTSSTAYARVSSMVGLLGATPIALSPQTHDDLVARVSHVPQLTASALVEMAGASADRETLLGLAAAGFRDVTRIAASHPGLWAGIIKSNHEAVLDALGRLRAELGSVGRLIEEQRWDDLEAFLEGARRARLEVFAKPDFGGEPIALWMMVPDRPGVLAEVTTAAGRLGANIEDLRIVHSTEGGRGRLELVIAGADRAQELTDALTELGYLVEWGSPE